MMMEVCPDHSLRGCLPYRYHLKVGRRFVHVEAEASCPSSGSQKEKCGFVCFYLRAMILDI